MANASRPRFSLEEMRQYHAFIEQHQQENPGSAAPTTKEWLVWRGWSAETEDLCATFTQGAASTQNVIDPRLRSPAAPPSGPAVPPPAPVRNPRRRPRDAQSESSEDEDEEADDESSDAESEPSRRKRRRKAHRGRKKSKVDRPLTRNGVELSEEQAQTYDELHVRFQFCHAHNLAEWIYLLDCCQKTDHGAYRVEQEPVYRQTRRFRATYAHREGWVHGDRLGRARKLQREHGRHPTRSVDGLQERDGEHILFGVPIA